MTLEDMLHVVRQEKKNLDLIWKHTHRDFKGKINGVRTIMVNRNGATMIVPLDDLNYREIEEKLAYALKKEAA